MSEIAELADFTKKNVIHQTNYENVIYKTTCTIFGEKNSVQGECQFTHSKLMFVPKASKNMWLALIPWQGILKMTQATRRSLEKGVQLQLQNEKTIMITQMKDRDIFWSYVLLLTDAVKSEKPSFGLIHRDETEVMRKLTLLRAPHTYEEQIPGNIADIMKLVKSSELWSEFFKVCECSDVVIGKWNKTKDGISRLIQFKQPLFQSVLVQSTYTLMKSGDTFTLELFMSYSRSALQGFLHIPVQFYFKKTDKDIMFRYAYSLDWIKETWDREFIEAAVARHIKMVYFFIKSKITNTEFKEGLFEGQWRKHQSYVIVILTLIISILIVIFSPKKINWYNVLAGFVALFFYFIL
ncbi:hypothetical protein TVAG_396490 [Trichomonas vaginalis G3]|uniref:VASt domain-containing protein n=1 Tax=Trichomonas vaginalis (strain ATCC PRA-98 / G3) TaxID=412133 RepID=A2FYC8_TRIV3|nr:uncharacterized protein TVAGG3_1080280 [Trichomonas vaginalis G3]EAX90092.1 hypothetical protein TVAG_396490 [Trichomonas vaginalis G3]KAI5482686.1 hypothetical protein TVAGG3_1080280 [Trichomonas vaginalis G3]|eukprot:XP_001303022.1 hypothetical protein [Trichomonas vaginalis G3]